MDETALNYYNNAARAVELSADESHADAARAMEAAAASGNASEDPIMLTSARVDENEEAVFGPVRLGPVLHPPVVCQ